MKFKLDENLPFSLVRLFLAADQEADTVLEEGLSGASDDRLYGRCRDEGRILVSLDLDFANHLRFPTRDTPGIVVLRPARPAMPLISALIGEMLTAVAQESPRARLWIVESGRIRILDPSDVS